MISERKGHMDTKCSLIDNTKTQLVKITSNQREP